MMGWFAGSLRAFRRVPVDEILSELLFEAERLQAEHMAAGEVHIALAAVYQGRSARIRAQADRRRVQEIRPCPLKSNPPCSARAFATVATR
jgi:hypothetical protein